MTQELTQISNLTKLAKNEDEVALLIKIGNELKLDSFRGNKAIQYVLSNEVTDLTGSSLAEIIR